jgi:integron integrase
MNTDEIKEKMLHRIRATGRSELTFKTYWGWCEKYIDFLRQHAEEFRNPELTSRSKAERWLSSLANGKEWVSKNTQNLALQSICYLYREVLKQPLEGVSALRSKRPENVREVVDQSELIRLFRALRGVELLAAQLMYGCGLRIGDVAKLRIKDISFERSQIHIHSGKGDKSRYVPFPNVLHEPVKKQIESMRVVHADDVRQNLNGVSLPDGFGRKCKSAHLEFAWWYLFASDNYSKCHRSGTLYRHHRDKSHIGRLIKDAVKRAGIDKRITSHCLRHSWATHSNEMGVDIRTLQVLLGHTDIRTTEIYVHANKDKATASKSPLESLLANPDLQQEIRKEHQVQVQKPTLRIFAG